MSHRYLQFVFAASLVLLIGGCKKDKENSAVVEEVPAAAPPKETDTSATLAEEPNLQQVGKDKPGSAKNTFHPGKGKGKNPGAASAPASEAGFSDAGHFVVQVAIFKSKKQAGALVEKLSGQGYPAYVAEVNDPVPQLSGTYQRVRIGKFLKIGDAKAFGDNTLKPLGYDYWVDNKKNDAVGGAGGSYSAPAAEPASGSATPSAEAPAPRKGKGKKSKTAAAEPSAPPGGTWGTPTDAAPSEPKTAEPAAPASGDSWSNSKPETSTPAPAASSDLPGTKPASAAASPSAPTPSPDAAPASPAPASSAKAPGQPAKADSGKVNLDEW
ncbi:MAG: SPOR domain-containing protein [Fibrobacteres bacterium]|nr:SPOR domain-containing protein [Fibrobacterota bacterium]